MEANNNLIDDTPGSDLGQKVVRPLWAALQNEMMERLNHMSIDDLYNRANQTGIASEGREPLDFSI